MLETIIITCILISAYPAIKHLGMVLNQLDAFDDPEEELIIIRITILYIHLLMFLGWVIYSVSIFIFDYKTPLLVCCLFISYQLNTILFKFIVRYIIQRLKIARFG